MTNNDVENGPISEAMNALVQLESNAIKCYIISVQDYYRQTKTMHRLPTYWLIKVPFSPLRKGKIHTIIKKEKSIKYIPLKSSHEMELGQSESKDP